jgi:hypothetical protein
MRNAKTHEAVKLICGFIFKEDEVFNKTRALLEKRLGKIDFTSQTFAFTHTNYYEREFGKELKRVFVSFKKLIIPGHLARIKNTTNLIEKKLSIKGNRRINIDPGYLELPKLVLASTKDYKHRIYLERGIFAEVTLFYQDKTFKPWEWTYPDYRTPEYIAIFNNIRELYIGQNKDK